jgi:hypothetical protein
VSPEQQLIFEMVSVEFKPESVAAAHAILFAAGRDDLLVATVAAAAASVKIHAGAADWPERACAGIAKKLPPDISEDDFIAVYEAMVALEPRT